MTIKLNQELLPDFSSEKSKGKVKKTSAAQCSDILTQSALEIKQIQHYLSVIVPSGRRSYEDVSRGVVVNTDIIQGSNRTFRVAVNGVKGPMHIKFNYLQEIPTNFVVEISYNERIFPVEATFRCPEKIVFAPDITKDYFPKNYIFIRTTAASRSTKCKLIVRFPKQDLIDQKEAEVRIARQTDPDYDIKQQELEYKKNIKKMVEFRV